MQLEIEHNPATLAEHVWEMAEDKFLTAENVGGWIESAGSHRQPSTYWGPISTAELVRIIFSRPGVANAEQIEQARIVFRRRFFAEYAEEIKQIESQLSTGADAGLREVQL